MTWDLYIRALLYLLLVLGLVVLSAWLLRFYSGSRVGARGSRRMRIVETLALDPRRRLVTLQWDGQEHLILLSANRDLLVASKPVAPGGFSELLAKDTS